MSNDPFTEQLKAQITKEELERQQKERESNKLKTAGEKLQQEIAEKSYEADRIHRAIEEIKTTGSKQRAEKEAKEKAQLDESMRLSTFRKIKEMYKKDSFFSRLSRKLNGNSPDWKSIEQYDLEALEYIERVRSGDTYKQRMDVKRNEELAKKDKNKSPYSKETLDAKRFGAFLRALGLSENAILKEIEAEKARRMRDLEVYGKDMSR